MMGRGQSYRLLHRFLHMLPAGGPASVPGAPPAAGHAGGWDAAHVGLVSPLEPVSTYAPEKMRTLFASFLGAHESFCEHSGRGPGSSSLLFLAVFPGDSSPPLRRLVCVGRGTPQRVWTLRPLP